MRYLVILCLFTLLIAVPTAQGQDELSLLTTDYLAPVLEENLPNLYSDLQIEIRAVPSEDFESVLATSLVSGEQLDLVLGPNILIGRAGMVVPDITAFTPRLCFLLDPPPDWCFPDDPQPLNCLMFPQFCPVPFDPCEQFPELCPPEIPPLCQLRPWICPPPFPPPPPPCNPLFCPEKVPLWDYELPLIRGEILDRFPTIETDTGIPLVPFDQFTEILDTLPVAIDMSNRVGFELQPAIFEQGLEPANPVADFTEADVLFTVACHYVENATEFDAAGFVPLLVEAYLPATFTINGYIMSTSAQPQLAAEVLDAVLQSADIQSAWSEETGLLPTDVDALSEILELNGL